MTHQLPDDEHVEQRVGWFELFYDLVAVAAISQAGKVYLKDPSWATTALIAASILVLFTVWLLTTISHGLFREESVWRRIILLLQMLGLVVGALSVGHYGLPNWIGFTALAVVFVTQALIYLVHRRASDMLHRPIRVVVGASLVSALAFAASAVVAREMTSAQASVVAPILLAIGVGIAIVPLLVNVLPGVQSSLDPHHLGERFGLLVIIVLGESFINLVGALGSLGEIPNVFAFASMFLVAYCIWSIYFTSVQAHRVPPTIGGLRVWILAHVLLLFSIVSVAVEFTDLTMHSIEDLNIDRIGNWTPLPLLGAMAALWLLARWSPGVPSVVTRLHAWCALLLALLWIVDLARGAEQVPIWVFLGAAVVIGDAVACAVITEKAKRTTRANVL